MKRSRYAIWESAGFLALIVGAGLIWHPEDPFLLAAHPHPFWLPVLVIATHHGSPAGWVVGLLGMTAYLGGMTWSGENIIETFHLDPLGFVEPALLLLVGGYVGEEIHSQAKRREFFQTRWRDTEDRLRDTEEERGRLDQAYRKLEGRLAGEGDTLTRFAREMLRIDGEDPAEIRRAFGEVLRDLLEVTRYRIHILGDDGIWRDEAGAPAPLSELAIIALDEGRTVSCREIYGHRENAPEGCLLAGPLLRKDGNIRSLVVIGEMPFVRFTHRAVLTFDILLRQTARAVDRALLMQEIRRRDVFDADLGLTSALFFRTSAEKLVQQAMRENKANALMLVRTDTPAPRLRDRLNIIVAGILRACLRASDLAAYVADRDLFCVFLPFTEEANADVVKRKIVGQFNAFGLRAEQGDTPLALQVEVFEVLTPADLEIVLDATPGEDG